MVRVAQRLKQFREWFGGGAEEERRKILVLLYAAIAVIAFAAIGVSAIGGQVDDSGEPLRLFLVPRFGTGFATVLLMILLVVIAAIGGLSFAFLRDRLREEIRKEGNLQRSSFPRAVALIVLVPLLTGVLAVFGFFAVAAQQQDTEVYAEQIQKSLEQVDQAIAEGTLDELQKKLTRQQNRRYLPIVGGGVVVVVFVAILVFSDRLAHEKDEEILRESRITRELRRDLARAADVALDDIAAEPDNRKAVIACYGRFEVVLEIHELARAPHQTPTEYIRSVVEEGPGLPETALLDLTIIYELAKFSTHEIMNEHKSSALGLLYDIRDNLVESLEQEDEEEKHGVEEAKA